MKPQKDPISLRHIVNVLKVDAVADQAVVEYIL